MRRFLLVLGVVLGVFRPLRFITATTTTIGAAGNDKTVFVFRHCLRSTPTGAYSGLRKYPNFDNYSSHTFPSWPVPVYQCLPRGLERVEEMGKQLKDEIVGSSPSRFLFKVDTAAKRCNDTAKALLRGLGAESHGYVSSPELFDPSAYGKCPRMNATIAREALRRNVRSTTYPPGHKDRLERLQNVLGNGVAPSLESIEDAITDDGHFNGGSSVASAFAEAFLMQWGGGLHTAWGNIANVEQISDFLETHIYYRGVTDRLLPVCAYTHTPMVREILKFLGGREAIAGDEERERVREETYDDAHDTLVLVGHDEDLDALAVLFGMSWITEPFPANATTPGSALRIRATEGGKIDVSVVYQSFAAQEDNTEMGRKVSTLKSTVGANTTVASSSPSPGTLLSAPVAFEWRSSSSSKTPLLKEVADYVQTRLDSSCVW